MGRLKNFRHELFAQAIVRLLSEGGFSQSRAYLMAGYDAQEDSARAQASRLLAQHTEILERVAELQAGIAWRNKITLDHVAERIHRASEMAFKNELPQVIINAEMAKARLAGLDTKRVEIGKPGDFSRVTSLPDLARKALIDASEARLAPDAIISEYLITKTIKEINRHQQALTALIDEACGNLATPIGKPIDKPINNNLTVI